MQHQQHHRHNNTQNNNSSNTQNNQNTQNNNTQNNNNHSSDRDQQRPNTNQHQPTPSLLSVNGAPLDGPADCTLACDEGHLTAHKIVLCAHSKYLQDILSKFPNADHPIIILTELNIADIKILVNYMYTGELVITNDGSPTSLLRAAQILKIDSLTDFDDDDDDRDRHDDDDDDDDAMDEDYHHQTATTTTNNTSTTTTTTTTSTTNTNGVHASVTSGLTDVLNAAAAAAAAANHRHTAAAINGLANRDLDMLTDLDDDDGDGGDEDEVLDGGGGGDIGGPLAGLVGHLGLSAHLNRHHNNDSISIDLTKKHRHHQHYQHKTKQHHNQQLQLHENISLHIQNDNNNSPNSKDNNNKIRCHLCNIGLSDVKCLYRHVLTRHLPEKWGYKCEFCDREFSRDDHLMRHYTTKHKNMEFNREKIRETRRLNREMAKNFHDQISTI